MSVGGEALVWLGGSGENFDRASSAMVFDGRSRTFTELEAGLAEGAAIVALANGSVLVSGGYGRDGSPTGDNMLLTFDV